MRFTIFALAYAALTGSALAQTADLKAEAEAQSPGVYRLYATLASGEYAGQLSEIQLLVNEDDNTEILFTTPDFDCNLSECGQEFRFEPTQMVHYRVSEDHPEFHGLVYHVEPMEDILMGKYSEAIMGDAAARKEEDLEEIVGDMQTKTKNSATVITQPTGTSTYSAPQNNTTTIDSSPKNETAIASADNLELIADPKETHEEQNEDKENSAVFLRENPMIAFETAMLIGLSTVWLL